MVPASVGTIGVLFVNLVVRTWSLELDAHLGDSPGVALRYTLEIDCTVSQTNILRARLAASLAEGGPLRLSSVATVEGAGHGSRGIRAELVSQGRSDESVEQLVAHMSQEAGIKSIRWQLAPADGTFPMPL